MTHDELLAQLEGLWHDSFKAPGYQALRAVVELHKPVGLREQDLCSTCWEEDSYSILMEYPCPTIQAIEKELG